MLPEQKNSVPSDAQAEPRERAAALKPAPAISGQNRQPDAGNADHAAERHPRLDRWREHHEAQHQIEDGGQREHHREQARGTVRPP